jgi:hypothetical protein
MKALIPMIALAVALLGSPMTPLAERIGPCPKHPRGKVGIVNHIRGVTVDPLDARITSLEMKLQKRRGHSFIDFSSLTTDSEGRFDFGEVPIGKYRLTTAGRKGFCDQSLLLVVKETGWSAFTMRLPVESSDSCNDCEATLAESKH